MCVLPYRSALHRTKTLHTFVVVVVVVVVAAAVVVVRLLRLDFHRSYPRENRANHRVFRTNVLKKGSSAIFFFRHLAVNGPPFSFFLSLSLSLSSSLSPVHTFYELIGSPWILSDAPQCLSQLIKYAGIIYSPFCLSPFSLVRLQCLYFFSFFRFRPHFFRVRWSTALAFIWNFNSPLITRRSVDDYFHGTVALPLDPPFNQARTTSIFFLSNLFLLSFTRKWISFSTAYQRTHSFLACMRRVETDRCSEEKMWRVLVRAPWWK